MLRFYGGLLSAGSIVRHSLAGYTRRVRPWLQYTLARLGLFVAIFVILLVFGVEGWLSAIFATVIALCISYLALGRLRQRVADDLTARRQGTATPTLAETDAAAEDAQIDAADVAGSEPDGPAEQQRVGE